MDAVVLVGGFGTRLRPLTFTTPKPLLPIGNVRQIEHVIAGLGRHGITRVVLALGFKPEPFLAAYPDGTCAGIPLHFAVEPEPLDTAGAIAFAARDAGVSDTFVVMNGDILCDLDVSALIGHHRSSDARATIHLTPVEDPSQYGVVETDDAGMVTRFVEKPSPGESESHHVNAGTYVLEPSVIDMVPLGSRMSIERDVFPVLVAEHSLAALATDDYWIDTGRPDTYLRANLDIVDGTRDIILSSTGAHAVVSATASVVHSVVGEGSEVGDGCILVDSVVLPGARLAPHVRLERSLVMGSVGEGSTLVDCVVGATGAIPPHSHLSGAKVPDPEGI